MPARSGSPSLLPLLRSETQSRLLERLVLKPELAFTVADLMDDLSVAEMSVRRELDRLVAASIVERERIGRQTVYRASVASPLYEPMRQLVERSVGLEALLREALASIGNIEVAVIFGSWARGEVDAESDVDVLVIGDFDYPELVARVAEVQRRAAREISFVALRRDEFRERFAEGSGFVTSVLDAPKLPLIGRLEDLLDGP